MCYLPNQKNILKAIFLWKKTNTHPGPQVQGFSSWNVPLTGPVTSSLQHCYVFNSKLQNAMQ